MWKSTIRNIHIHCGQLNYNRLNSPTFIQFFECNFWSDLLKTEWKEFTFFFPAYTFSLRHELWVCKICRRKKIHWKSPFDWWASPADNLSVGQLFFHFEMKIPWNSWWRISIRVCFPLDEQNLKWKLIRCNHSGCFFTNQLLANLFTFKKNWEKKKKIYIFS